MSPEAGLATAVCEDHISDPKSLENAAAAEKAETVLWLQTQLEGARPVTGTPGERYLAEHRDLRPPWPPSLLWSDTYRIKEAAPPRSCLLAVVTNEADDPIAVQSTEIDPRTGLKSRRTDEPRLSRGEVSGGAVFLGNPEETATTLIVGEGVETVLTRAQVGPCDPYACLGNLRFIEPRPHYRRVEILADTDARQRARRLARDYAQRGLSAFVVTVPDALGPKADLNDALRQQGSNTVLMAIEDAERFAADPNRSGSLQFDLEIGSDIEIARRVIDRLEDLYGPIVVCEGRIWRFDKTHWAPLDEDHVVRFVHRADGTTYAGADGKTQLVKLNKNRVASIIDAAMKYRHNAGFFATPPCGINSESGFIQIAADGSTALFPHARQWRQRHVVRGRWPVNVEPAGFWSGLLAKFLRSATSGDIDLSSDPEGATDASAKVNLLGEIAGCVALGYATRLRNPKAIVPFSEEGATGKSTYLKLLRALPNPDAVASVPPGKLADEKYAFRLIGKSLNASDELTNRAVKADVFKRFVTGEPVPARDVYRSAVDFPPIALHIYSTNVLPSFSGGVDGGVIRRLLPIEFPHVVPENERDPDLVDRILNEEPDILLHFAVEGACRLLRQRDFTIPPSSRELLNEWMLDADPVRAWTRARVEITEDSQVVAVSTLYADFVLWAEEHGLKRDFLPTSVSFGKRLRSAEPRLQYDRSNGSIYRNAKLRKSS
jgi:P4 family phage/plasmid primase-like protien